MDDVGDVAASAARTRDGVNQRESLFREGDVGADQPHDVTPSVNVLHTS